MKVIASNLSDIVSVRPVSADHKTGERLTEPVALKPQQPNYLFLL